MNFTLAGNNFKIEYSEADDVIACSSADPYGAWTWFLTENSDAAMRGDETVTELLDRFLTALNAKLALLFGDVTPPGEFDSPLEELKYRIENNISFNGSTLELNI